MRSEPRDAPVPHTFSCAVTPPLINVPSTLPSQKGPTMTYRKITARAVHPALLTLLSAVVLLLSSGSVAQASAMSRTAAAKPTVVLVHGAWADGSSWDGVVARLQRDGYTVDVPSNPLWGVASDSAYLASYLKTVTGPIILAGHSYGGMVITNAATGNPAVKALVYIDAFIPAQGETLLQLAGATPCPSPGRPELTPTSMSNRAYIERTSVPTSVSSRTRSSPPPRSRSPLARCRNPQAHQRGRPSGPSR